MPGFASDENTAEQGLTPGLAPHQTLPSRGPSFSDTEISDISMPPKDFDAVVNDILLEKDCEDPLTMKTGSDC